MRLYAFGMLCVVALVNSGFAMTFQQRSRIEMERVRQLTEECKIAETVKSLGELASFKIKPKGGMKERDLVSLMKDAVDNVKQSIRTIDEKCASWKGNRSALLPLSSQKAFILRNLSDLYVEIRGDFEAIHTTEAKNVRDELRALGVVGI